MTSKLRIFGILSCFFYSFATYAAADYPSFVSTIVFTSATDGTFWEESLKRPQAWINSKKPKKILIQSFNCNDDYKSKDIKNDQLAQIATARATKIVDSLVSTTTANRDVFEISALGKNKENAEQCLVKILGFKA